MADNDKLAFIVGASGAVGRCLVDLLSASKEFSKVVLLGRRTIEIPEVSHIEQKIVDFENLKAEDFQGFDVGFCSLGTTRAKSGAKMFYVVDHDYVLNVAKIAKEQGTKTFVLVTSGGSNENSMFLYPKTKGEVERDIAALGFERFLIVRPGFLDGKREEPRMIDSVLRVLLKPFTFVSNRLAISTEDVAKAMMVGYLSKDVTGKVIWENPTLLEKASEYSAERST